MSPSIRVAAEISGPAFRIPRLLGGKRDPSRAAEVGRFSGRSPPIPRRRSAEFRISFLANVPAGGANDDAGTSGALKEIPPLLTSLPEYQIQENSQFFRRRRLYAVGPESANLRADGPRYSDPSLSARTHDFRAPLLPETPTSQPPAARNNAAQQRSKLPGERCRRNSEIGIACAFQQKSQVRWSARLLRISEQMATEASAPAG